MKPRLLPIVFLLLDMTCSGSAFSQDKIKHLAPYTAPLTTNVIGRTGVLLGVPFHATCLTKADRNGHSWGIVDVNGNKLPEIIWYSADDIEGFVSKANERGDGRLTSVWAFETGEYFDVDKAYASYSGEPRVRKLSFRTKMCILRGSREDDVMPPGDSGDGTGVTLMQLNDGEPAIGRLGCRVGEWMHLVGTWKYEARHTKHEDLDWNFIVTARNGSTLLEPISLSRCEIAPMNLSVEVLPVDGQTWELDAYEDGRFEGTPKVAFEIIGGVGWVEPRQYGFYPRLKWRRLLVRTEVDKAPG